MNKKFGALAELREVESETSRLLGIHKDSDAVASSPAATASGTTSSAANC